MVYEAVPDDVEIQKLTVSQRDALSRHKTHENINTLLGNENTPLVIGGAALLTALPILFNLFRKAAEDQGIVTDELTWGKIYKASLLGPAGLSTLAAKEVVKKTGTIGDIKVGSQLGAPVSFSLKEIWDELIK
jgi:hypothetical protein